MKETMKLPPGELKFFLKSVTDDLYVHKYEAFKIKDEVDNVAFTTAESRVRFSPAAFSGETVTPDQSGPTVTCRDTAKLWHHRMTPQKSYVSNTAAEAAAAAVAHTAVVAAEQPTRSLVDTNPEGVASSDTEPDTDLGATRDGSTSTGARPSVSLGTLQPLMDGLTGLSAPSGAPPAAPPPGAGMARTSTPPAASLPGSSLGELGARHKAGAVGIHPAKGDDLNGLTAPSGPPAATPPSRAALSSFGEISARYADGAERRRHQYMGDHLPAVEQIVLLRSQLDQATIANAALTEQFMAKVADTHAEVTDLTQRLAVSSAAAEAALANGGDPTERQELMSSHYFLGRDLAKSQKTLADLQVASAEAAATAQSATAIRQIELAAKESELSAAQADLAKSQAALAPALAKKARLSGVIEQLTRDNAALGKRPVAAPIEAAPAALTLADVMALIAADRAAVARNETVPMDTEDPGGSSSGARHVAIRMSSTWIST
eukprot:gene24101-biopygen18592